DTSASTTLTIAPAAVVTTADPQTANANSAAQTLNLRRGHRRRRRQQTANANSAAQALTLTARVTDPSNAANVVSEGTVTFTVRDSSGHTIGSPVSAPVVRGAAVAPYVLPAGLPPA